jgi:hypothetical protein
MILLIKEEYATQYGLSIVKYCIYTHLTTTTLIEIRFIEDDKY